MKQTDLQKIIELFFFFQNQKDFGEVSFELDGLYRNGFV